ncbi:unnamed protein product, partial [Rotaria sordida]
MGTNIRSELSSSEIELVNRVHAYFLNNNPTKFFYFYSTTPTNSI